LAERFQPFGRRPYGRQHLRLLGIGGGRHHLMRVAVRKLTGGGAIRRARRGATRESLRDRARPALRRQDERRRSASPSLRCGWHFTRRLLGRRRLGLSRARVSRAFAYRRLPHRRFSG
jgi:hypothetical protein